MESFATVFARAAARHGGGDKLEKRLPQAKSARRLAELPDRDFLAEMAKCIFRAGFVWRVVEAKWPGFEEAFVGFDPDTVADWTDRDLGRLAKDERIIRNPQKIRAVRDNATFVVDTAAEHGSFARLVADWPATDIVGLWGHLKSAGHRLGGNSGPMMLRGIGKDTFMLSRDVVGWLVEQGVVSKAPTGKADLRRTQEAFNALAEESGRPLCQLSRIVSMSFGEVH